MKTNFDFSNLFSRCSSEEDLTTLDGLKNYFLSTWDSPRYGFKMVELDEAKTSEAELHLFFVFRDDLTIEDGYEVDEIRIHSGWLVLNNETKSRDIICPDYERDEFNNMCDWFDQASETLEAISWIVPEDYPDIYKKVRFFFEEVIPEIEKDYGEFLLASGNLMVGIEDLFDEKVELNEIKNWIVDFIKTVDEKTVIKNPKTQKEFDFIGYEVIHIINGMGSGGYYWESKYYNVGPR